MTRKLLICGSRNPKYDDTFFRVHIISHCGWDNLINGEYIIIEGCCPNSADEFAERFCMDFRIPIIHFPAKKGQFLERDREMVNACDEVLAFWDGKSAGTKYTIYYAKRKKRPVGIINVGGG